MGKIIAEILKQLGRLLRRKPPIKKPPKAPKKPPACKKDCSPKPQKNQYNKLSEKEIKKAIESEKALIKEHQKKLADYKKDPLKYDNQGTLKSAKDPETYNKIIQGRIRKLENDILKHERELQKLREALQP